jgi:hypothetical protein
MTSCNNFKCKCTLRAAFTSAAAVAAVGRMPVTKNQKLICVEKGKPIVLLSMFSQALAVGTDLCMRPLLSFVAEKPGINVAL